MIKIFVSAFSCMPHMGSEPGVGWHWIIEMSKYFELWVLVHKEEIDDIELFVKAKGIDKKIHFIYYDIPFNSVFFKNGKFCWVRTYYLVWTILANRIVRKTMKENNIKIFHNLTFGNAIWPVSRYGQKQFFIWGPIGGVETISSDYTQHYDYKSKLAENIRQIIAKVIKYTPGFYLRCRHANLIFCKTEAMINMIPVKYQNKAILFTDVAVDIEAYKKISKPNIENNNVLHYISVGRLDAWRGFDVLIESFTLALLQYPEMKLTILGEGSDRERLEQLIKSKNIGDKIVIIGNVPITEYNHYMLSCDVVVNSCLKEGAVTVSFDSMRYGKPLICVDSGGYTRYFSDEYAVVLPQQSRKDLILSMKNAILLLTDSNKRVTMGNKAKNIGTQFSWKNKGIQIQEIINKAYSDKTL
ncbi:glycosyltransferase family 1 protein [Tannerella sp. AM09-19]|nr:glycosyltransferase family 1 protein [Tannerella sp. AM09-19]